MMTIVRSLVLGLAVSAFAACNQQPYSKIKSIEDTIFHHADGDHGHGHGDEKGKEAHGEKSGEEKKDQH